MFSLLYVPMYPTSPLYSTVSMTTSLQTPTATNAGKMSDSATEKYVVAVYNFIKVYNALELIEKQKREIIFPKNPIGTDYISPVLHAVEQVLRIKFGDEKIDFINRRLHICRSQQMAIYFVDRTSGRLPDAVLSKIINISSVCCRTPTPCRRTRATLQKKNIVLHDN